MRGALPSLCRYKLWRTKNKKITRDLLPPENSSKFLVTYHYCIAILIQAQVLTLRHCMCTFRLHEGRPKICSKSKAGLV